MTPPEIDAAVHKQLGELVAGVRSLQEANRRLEDMIRRSDDKSEESRSRVHKRMDEMVDRVGKVETTIVTVQEDISEMKPVTDDVKRWKLMGLGALGMIGIAGMALGVSFADALKRIALVVIGK
jgi:polyhydroxyalkanoate synthesis regulator phasin